MTAQDDKAVIAKLQAKLQAQQKTIEALMDAAEKRSSTATSSMELLSQNLTLERVVQHKTEILQRQGEELKTALQDLQLTQSRLLHAQKMESVGQLAAGIAHEINSPSQFIGSNIEFLLEAFTDVKLFIDSLQQLLRNNDRKPDLQATWRETAELLEQLDWDYLQNEIPTAIRQSKEGIKRVTSIVQAMKEFSHPGIKDKALHDLNRIIETTITVARNEWKYYAEIKTKLAPDLPHVKCLANEIGQVFLNLLVNAAQSISSKYPDGTQKGLITFSTGAFPEYVEIRIEDTGVGIPKNIQDRIFDPFFTTKSVGKGTGQGLAISHDVIVKKHNGTISFRSEVGQGTTFTIRLPLETSEETTMDNSCTDNADQL